MARRAAATGETSPCVARSRRGAKPHRRAAPSSSSAHGQQERDRAPGRVPPGAALDAIPLAMVMPDSLRSSATTAATPACRSCASRSRSTMSTNRRSRSSIAPPRAPSHAGVRGAPGRDARALSIAQLELSDLEQQRGLFREGDVGTSMFVISEGEVEVETTVRISHARPRRVLRRDRARHRPAALRDRPREGQGGAPRARSRRRPRCRRALARS